MTVGELIEILKKYPQDMRIQMRDDIGDWSVYVVAQNLGNFMYLQSVNTDLRELPDDRLANLSDLKALAARESQQ